MYKLSFKNMFLIFFIVIIILTIIYYRSLIYEHTIPYVTISDRLALIEPFLYYNSPLYSNNITNIISKWIIKGNYQSSTIGLLLGGNGSCAFIYNNEVIPEYFRVYEFNIIINNTYKLSNNINISLYNVLTFQPILTLSLTNTTQIYATGITSVYERVLNISNVKNMSILFIVTPSSIEVFIKKLSVNNDWVTVAQIPLSIINPSDFRWGISVCNSRVILKNFNVYESAGSGIRDLRPVYDWSHGYSPNSILRDKNGYMLFFATESYYNSYARVIILKTKDLIHFKPVVSIDLGGITGQGVLFKWKNGLIYGYLMDWSQGSPPYQGGLHRIVEIIMDSNFTLLGVFKGVALINAPPGGSLGHYDISIFEFNGTWYAVTSSYTGGTILWKLPNGPTSPSFIYVKTIFPSGFENPTLYPVRCSGGIYFLLSAATTIFGGSWHVIVILNRNFSPIAIYPLAKPSVWTAGTTVLLNPWYVFINQGQLPDRLLVSGDLGPGAYAEVYRLKTNCVYYNG